MEVKKRQGNSSDWQGSNHTFAERSLPFYQFDHVNKGQPSPRGLLTLLSNEERRQMSLVEALAFSKNRLSLNDFAEENNHSLRTLVKDVQHLNEIYPTIEVQKQGGEYYLRFAEDSGFDLACSHILKGNKAFCIFERYLTDPDISDETLGRSLYTSASTIYRAIKDLSRVLKDNYHLRLSRNPYRFDGDERVIRQLFTDYLSLRYPSLQWPFEDISEETISQFILFVAEKLHLPKDSMLKRQNKILFAVAIKRMQYNYHLQFPSKEWEEQALQRVAPLFEEKETLENYQQLLNYPLTNSAIAEIFLPFTDPRWIQEDDADASLDFKGSDEWAFLMNLLHDLEERLYIRFEDKEKLMVKMHNLAFSGLDLCDSGFSFLSSSWRAVQQIKTSLSEVYEILDDAMARYITTIYQTKNEVLVQELIFVLISHPYQMVEPVPQMKPVKILVVLTSQQSELELRRVIEKLETASFIDVEKYRSATLTMEKLKQENCDIVISDFSLPEMDGKSVFVYKGYFNDSEFLSLKEALEELVQARYQDCIEK